MSPTNHRSSSSPSLLSSWQACKGSVASCAASRITQLVASHVLPSAIFWEASNPRSARFYWRNRPNSPLMSAAPPKADMCSAMTDVCFGPIADMTYLLDHLIGGYEKLIGYCEAESL